MIEDCSEEEKEEREEPLLSDHSDKDVLSNIDSEDDG